MGFSLLSLGSGRYRDMMDDPEVEGERCWMNNSLFGAGSCWL